MCIVPKFAGSKKQKNSFQPGCSKERPVRADSEKTDEPRSRKKLGTNCEHILGNTCCFLKLFFFSLWHQKYYLRSKKGDKFIIKLRWLSRIQLRSKRRKEKKTKLRKERCKKLRQDNMFLQEQVRSQQVLLNSKFLRCKYNSYICFSFIVHKLG